MTEMNGELIVYRNQGGSVVQLRTGGRDSVVVVSSDG